MALDQVALPVTWHQPVRKLRRTHMDADHVGKLATSIHSTRARPASGCALQQTDDQLLTDRQGIDRAVDRLATD